MALQIAWAVTLVKHCFGSKAGGTCSQHSRYQHNPIKVCNDYLYREGIFDFLAHHLFPPRQVPVVLTTVMLGKYRKIWLCGSSGLI